MATTETTVPGAETIYQEITASIRATDEISFKLLGLVPLVSGTALATLLLQDSKPYPALVTLFAVFAAAVTLGLFRWELRNVQECGRLVRCAEALAAERLERSGVPAGLRTRLPSPQRIGKTEAEKLIYGTTTVAWLALPVTLDAVSADVSALTVVYVVSASIILIGTFASLIVRTRVATSRILLASDPARDEWDAVVRSTGETSVREQPLPASVARPTQ